MEGNQLGFPVYDYRNHVQNILVTPQIRSRFLRSEPGFEAGGHTHDLGHEIFLVLQGRAVFEIDGETEELGPGQMCVALVGQMHSYRVVSDDPMTMYLSVAPHIQPTHTMWDDNGGRLPHRFVPSSAYDIETDAQTPFDGLVDGFVSATRAIAEAAQNSADKEAELSEALKLAHLKGDEMTESRARSEMWDALYPVYELVNELASVWNDLAPRAGKVE